MASPVAYTGKTVGGKFIPDDRAAFCKAFLRKDGTPMVVTAKRLVPNRSSNANRYWFGVVVAMFMDEMGIRDKEEMHHIILENIGHYDLKQVGKKEIRVVKSTHDLPQDDFAVLIDAAGQLFAEWYGGMIPGPDSAQAQAMMGGS
jgi:hypothetical protein